MKKEIHIYHHVCLMNNGLEIALDQLNLLYTSDLLNNATSINIGIKYESTLNVHLHRLLDVIHRYNKRRNIRILYIDENDSVNGDHELMTSRYFKSYADSLENGDEQYILYFHTKGVSRYGTPLEIPAKHWRIFMEYFTISKWKTCYDILNSGCESCGTFTFNMNIMDWHINRNKPTIATDTSIYYPGTFYWLSTSLIKKIPRKYFTIHNEYRVHAIEALPGLIEHRHFSFKKESRDLYNHIILPNEYV